MNARMSAVGIFGHRKRQALWGARSSSRGDCFNGARAVHSAEAGGLHHHCRRDWKLPVGAQKRKRKREGQGRGQKGMGHSSRCKERCGPAFFISIILGSAESDLY
jgi:hypothetical protein